MVKNMEGYTTSPIGREIQIKASMKPCIQQIKC